jgi:hypothetical protein
MPSSRKQPLNKTMNGLSRFSTSAKQVKQSTARRPVFHQFLTTNKQVLNSGRSPMQCMASNLGEMLRQANSQNRLSCCKEPHLGSVRSLGVHGREGAARGLQVARQDYALLVGDWKYTISRPHHQPLCFSLLCGCRTRARVTLGVRASIICQG